MLLTQRLQTYQQPLLFAAGMLGFGSLTSALAMRFLAETVFTPENVPLLEPVGWLFPLAWIVIFPCMGIATSMIWALRREQDVQLALLIFAVTVLQQMTFWISDSVRMTTIIDATGLLLASLLAVSYARHSVTAALWLSPLLVWMPVTLLIKLWLWTLV